MRAEIRLLGKFEVAVDGRPVPPDAWRRRDPAALVKLLALSRGHRMLRERVIDALWPDLLEEQALPRLHKAAFDVIVRESSGGTASGAPRTPSRQPQTLNG